MFINMEWDKYVHNLQIFEYNCVEVEVFKIISDTFNFLLQIDDKFLILSKLICHLVNKLFVLNITDFVSAFYFFIVILDDIP